MSAVQNEWRRIFIPALLDARDRGLEDFCHVYFCFLDPECKNRILLGVKIELAISASMTRAYCPMLDFRTDSDFRPEIRQAITREVGIKSNERLEGTFICPPSLRETHFITNQKYNRKADISDAWFLPQPVDLRWRRYL